MLEIEAKLQQCESGSLVVREVSRMARNRPSCGARRMADSAAHLVDGVLPEKPVRQWVLSVPFQLRYLCSHP